MQRLTTCLIKASLLLGLSSTPYLTINTPAEAKLKVCNETGKARDVAIGYKGKDGWTSEGWWKLDDGECATPIKDDLTNHFFYYRAKHKGGDFDGEKYNFCTDSKAFTIVGDEDCESRGFKVEEFRQLKLLKGTTGFTLTLDESTIYSKDTQVSDSKEQAASSEQVADVNPSAQQPTGPDAPPGTHGEPYTLSAFFEGCDHVDGLLWCNFRSEKWNYVVKDDGNSHTYLLEELDGLPIGGEHVISGDMIAYTDDGADITLRSYEPISNSTSSEVAPGTYGEPYTVTGIFRGCRSEDGLNFCEFSAEGWRYILIDDGKTDASILRQVRNLNTSHRYVIAGDITNMGDITVEVTIRSIEAINDNSNQILMNQLTGFWRSIDDPTYTMEFTSDFQKFDFSEGNLSSEGRVSFTKECDDLQVLRSGELVMQVDESDGVLCYSMIEIMADKLVLMYLPRGNFLEFQRDLGLN